MADFTTAEVKTADFTVGFTTGPLNTVLVANRGEIARRVFATCRRLGYGTVAVFSDADSDALHVREADVAVRLPGNTSAETYLRSDLLIAAALAAGADAVHPGYGFLSEKEDFAQAVVDAGLRWLGPPPSAIAAMGSKVAAKKMMAAAGVPVLRELSADEVGEADLPVLIKASAGGGGRGMRVVRSLAELPGQWEAAQAEAASAFGDGTVFCEQYIETGRHIEVQVLADAHGTVWAVGERECSIQRRHQKVVEEAPSPFVQAHPELREKLFGAARDAAAVIGYVGAGTVEFLVAPDGSFAFLEMNTRLQVEHPVTELTTGLDLVAWQLRIAAGEALPASGEPGAADKSGVPGGPSEPGKPGGPGRLGEPTVRGSAIEVRLYAEDPAKDWQPASGTLHRFAVPGVSCEFEVVDTATRTEPLLRLDSGVESGSVVGVYYDPMLAKVIAWAPRRAEAARVLASALAGSEIHGVVTNRDLLVNVLRHPAFLAGDTDTAFFSTYGLDVLAAPLASPETERVSALAGALAVAAGHRAEAPVLGGLPSGWRNVPSQAQRRVLAAGSSEYEVRYRFGRDGLLAEGYDGVGLVSATPAEVVLDIRGLRRAFRVGRHGGAVVVDSPLGSVTFTLVPTFTDPADTVAAGSLLAPMPGSVVRLGVAGVGDVVEAGQPILWLEAMKMEHQVSAPVAGVLSALPVSVGSQVDVGTVLAVVEVVAVVEEAGAA
ncbi:acetyl/propionyl/methylcrotonyl-CoA carboxylase subunit alpha [Catenulispora rubra]|uniref:acetyl/propionyl/methylcrotonyl-CoA carboxylase subunit alpha n=1 Tax=Catenulispora rubra TaxID=280293 RepID=UPI001E5610F3|nr:biotin carboxylase N-terminal domain-containing protein [Catenulispora rubra]